MKILYKHIIFFAAFALALSQVSAQQPSQPAIAANNAEKSSGRLQVGDAVEVGRPIQTSDPVVPKEFRKKTVSVVLHATLTTDGSFRDLVAVSGDAALTGPAIDAVRQWGYSACTLNGAPIELPAYVSFSFNQGNVTGFVEPDLPFPTKQAATKEETEVLKVGEKGTTAPKATYAPDPEYSETARVAKYQGVVVLGMLVGPDGSPQDVWVTRKLGLGLDQKAIQAVRQWKFEPATRDGNPVAVRLNIEVQFRLY